MKQLLTFLLLTITPFIYSQKSNNKVLDEKNGFKDFKIGDDLSKWKNSLTLTNTADGGIDYYDYNGTCCNRLFSTDLAQIRLGFKMNKLVVIFLITQTTKNYSSGWTSDEYRNLKSNFEELLQQKGVEFTTDDNSGNVKCGWLGTNIQLTLTYEYMGLKNIDGKYIKTDRCTVLVGRRANVNDGF